MQSTDMIIKYPRGVCEKQGRVGSFLPRLGAHRLAKQLIPRFEVCPFPSLRRLLRTACSSLYCHSLCLFFRFLFCNLTISKQGLMDALRCAQGRMSCARRGIQFQVMQGSICVPRSRSKENHVCQCAREHRELDSVEWCIE
jgi:hypothetical protein